MRLGLDIGTNSIGWWLYATETGRPNSIIDAGVRIFSDGRDPKSGSSLAVDRRIAGRHGAGATGICSAEQC